MLEELAAQTNAVFWAIASMLFFLGAWVAMIVWTMRRRREEMDARARLPLEEMPEQPEARSPKSDDRPVPPSTSDIGHRPSDG